MFNLDTEKVSEAIRSTGDFTFVLMEQFARLLADPGANEHLFEIRFHALRELHSQILFYQKRSFHPRLLFSIAEKKGNMILSANGKAELQAILHPKLPIFDGRDFRPGPYLTPEEELICWSETSLKAPLNSDAARRFQVLFREVFPDEAGEWWGDAS